MDLMASCKEKLAHFRLKEIKEVLTQLGLSKQGKKQDLVNRILSSLSDEQAPKITKKNIIRKDEVIKIIDEAYRKLQPSGPTELASKEQGATDCNSVEVIGKFDNSIYSDLRVRCPCGDTLETDSMIRCEDPGCNVWQHIGCVLIPQEVTEGKLPVHDIFYCELCRLSRADPFLVSVSHPLYPRKMTTVNVTTDGTNPLQTVEETFQLTGADKLLLTKQDFDIQAWCMLLNDKVPFRMQWPQYADLQVNGIPVRAVNRPGSQLLGANGRDNGPTIKLCFRDGSNIISLSGCDARIFCFGVRIVKRLALEEIFNMIPKESDGEHLEDALARVRRCIGGGGGATEADSDSDVEVVADSFTVNLRCPMSGSRIKTAGRFKPCVHMGCFDLEVFVQMNERSRKWQCPICLQNYTLENIIIDPYFNRVTSLMRSSEEDVTDIEVKQDGSWRVKAKSVGERSRLDDIGKWHSPDGTLSILNGEEVEQASKQIKQESSLDGDNTDLKQISNGLWQDNSYGNCVMEATCISFSSSGTGSSYNGEDPNHLDLSANNRAELDYVDSAAHGEVIILSDSDDDDNDMLMSSTLIPMDGNDGGGVIGGGWSEPQEQGYELRMDPLIPGNDSDLGEASNLAAEPTTVCHCEADMDYGLIGIPLANDREDPSLQIFLPTKPGDPREQQQVNVSNDIQRTGDWFSLRLGDGAPESTSGPTAVESVGQQPPPSPPGGAMDSFADNASLVDMECRSKKATSENPFTFSRQKRSVRPRLSFPAE